MESERYELEEWQTPSLQEFGVSAEATAYMDILEFDDE